MKNTETSEESKRLESISISAIKNLPDTKKLNKNMCPLLILLVTRKNTKEGLMEIFKYVRNCAKTDPTNESFDIYVCVGAMALVGLELDALPRIETYSDCIMFFLYYRVLRISETKKLNVLKAGVFDILRSLSLENVKDIIDLHEYKLSRFYTKYLEIILIFLGKTDIEDAERFVEGVERGTEQVIVEKSEAVEAIEAINAKIIMKDDIKDTERNIDEQVEKIREIRDSNKSK